MLDKVLDVGHVRSTMGAFWFYVTSVVLLVGISTTAIHVLHHLGFVESTGGNFFIGGEMYTIIGSLFVLLVSGLILTHRKMTGDIFAVLLVAVGLYLAYTSSVMLGLIPVAILTMLKK